VPSCNKNGHAKGLPCASAQKICLVDHESGGVEEAFMCARCLPYVPPIRSICLVRGTLIPIFRRKWVVDWHGCQTTKILRQLLRTRGLLQVLGLF